MLMKKILILLLIMLVILAIPFGKAAIVMKEPSSIYNLGDGLETSLNILELEKIQGLIKVSLECNSSFLFYVMPITIEANIEKKIEVPQIHFSREMLGNCHVFAQIENFNGSALDSARTKDFFVSNIINIALEINKKTFLPGEKVEINAKAIKENGKGAEGIASIILIENQSAILKNGSFSLSYVLPEKIVGRQEIVVSVEDSAGNKGIARESINVKAVPKDMVLQLNNRTFLPGEKLSVKAILLDQIGNVLDENSSVSLKNPEGKEAAIKVIKAGENFEYVFANDAKPGDWHVVAYAAGMERKELVYVKEHASISISIEGGILEIRNTGNVVYNKPIEINFEKSGKTITVIKNLNLSIGEEKKFELSAPQGNYDVTINSETAEKTFKNIALTGNVVDVIEEKLKIGKGEFKKLITLVLILAALALVAYIKMRR